MFQLLQLLNDGQYHSGEAIGKHLGISRAAVWKRIAALEQSMGLPVERLKGKGYRLPQGQWLLDQELLEQAVALPVTVYQSIDSTNQAATLLLAEQSAPFLVLAEQQTAGRGRRGRDWVSPPAQNIYLSLVWPVKRSFAQLEGLSLVVGLALYRVLKQQLPELELGLKWPNDLLLNGSKCAGILLEIVGDPSDRCHVIIGVGINVNMQQAEIDQAWTSLREAGQQLLNRNQLVQHFIVELQGMLEQHFSQGFSGFRQEWQQANSWQGHAVSVSTASQVIHGQLTGVADTGGLIVTLDNGEQQVFSGGEISLRKQHDS
ncbi:bifunctional biotin--[acetyl-CoA-carboxylase] ligase/biotin operon repressor BirA [Thiopseudomonas alkaliphila]|uniref:bifunctional biotin--[acetyl-CoA-carboxylase] ligase/biotin operon repressor BirA n=1 Tax=Thiopseudomonas alkaliphila TaxID=1697053 RepID=UPI0025752F25|nr:bifunctional biotin--[acetyl-CoA-carboxylase] ligase/biotin operon repressor BirA [Thiopseudomonas alkaliphila]MDM1707541.1 bifunctional biotin--[acetyl-CoA-carboxylase] ligase/biotin operon repressor BirA [Thiopseudomonas alkaliphila]